MTYDEPQMEYGILGPFRDLLISQSGGIIRVVLRKPQSVSKRFQLSDPQSSEVAEVAKVAEVALASLNCPAISIIIPSLNEEAQIAVTLAALRPAAANHGAEVIVIDGGSLDRTLEMARRFDFARAIEFKLANRSLQMNEGARLA